MPKFKTVKFTLYFKKMEFLTMVGLDYHQGICGINKNPYSSLWLTCTVSGVFCTVHIGWLPGVAGHSTKAWIQIHTNPFTATDDPGY